jgi:hypothetical protein
VSPANQVSESRVLSGFRGGRTEVRRDRPARESSSTKVRRVILLALVFAAIGRLPVTARSQALSVSEDSSTTAAITTLGTVPMVYVRPTQKTRIANYAFDSFGPYPLAGAAFAAGVNQLSNSPLEWNQGLRGYGRRFGSDFAIAAVGTTTRYGLAEAFKEDTLYYRCDCMGPIPRLRHALISTFTGRRGDDGHRIFSFSALVAPYAGSMVAVYGWYPGRFGAKDAFRMGNYSLLGYMGGNTALEFFYSGPHALISRMHLNNAHGSPEPGPNN